MKKNTLKKITKTDQKLVSMFMGENIPAEIDYDYIIKIKEKIESIKFEIPNFYVVEWFEVNIGYHSCAISSGLKGTEEYMISPYQYNHFTFGDDLLMVCWEEIVLFVKWFKMKGYCDGRN